MVETVISGKFQILIYGSIIIDEKNGYVNIWLINNSLIGFI